MIPEDQDVAFADGFGSSDICSSYIPAEKLKYMSNLLAITINYTVNCK